MKKNTKKMLLQLGVECRLGATRSSPGGGLVTLVTLLALVVAVVLWNMNALHPMATRALTHTKALTLASPIVGPATVPVHAIYIPEIPFVQAEQMVQEAIGETVLNDDSLNPLRNCSVTTQFQLHIPTTPNEPWILQSLTASGDVKHSGGDELYVEWIADGGSTWAYNNGGPDDRIDMAVARVTDQRDGTYQLDFVTPPLLHDRSKSSPHSLPLPTQGRLTLYYDYTCDIGALVSPLKDHYARAGEVHVSFAREAVPRPPIRAFEPPNANQAIDLSQYDHVIGFGDSIMMQLVRRYKAQSFWHPRLSFHGNVNQALSTLDETETLLTKLRDFHGAQFEAAAARNETVAVIVGSATWDIMRGRIRPGLQAHLLACRTWLHHARHEYPHVDWYWKSPSAIVLHRRGPLSEIGDKVWLSRSRYISDAVPRRVYEAQKALMNELDVPFLDLFDAYYLSGPWTLKGDSRHYEDKISALLLSYFWPGLDKNGAFAKERQR